MEPGPFKLSLFKVTPAPLNPLEEKLFGDKKRADGVLR
jgi:hypothetical protein